MKGANLRAVPVEPNNTDTQNTPGLSVEDSQSIGQGNTNELDALPAAAIMPPQGQSGAPEGSSVANDDGLNDLPDVGGNLGKVYDSVSHLDPKKASEVIGTAQKLGQPEDLVAAHLPEAKRAAESPPGNFFQDVENRYPGTTKFLSDPRMMAQAHDDIPNIAQHEKMTDAITHATGLIDAWHAGFQSSVSGLTARQRVPDMDLGPDAGIGQKAVSMIGQMAGDLPAMAAGGYAGGSAGAIAGGFAGSVFPGVGTIAGMGAGGLVGAGVGAFATPAALRTAMMQQFANGNPKDLAEVANRGSQVIKEASKQGLVGLATVLTGGAASMAVAGEAVPALVKTLAPLMAENTAMTYAGKGVEGELASPKDLLENAVPLVGMHYGFHYLGATGSRLVQEVKAEQARDFYDGLGDAASKSKLLERSPEAYANMLGGLAKDTPVSDVYIPVEKFNEYFQSKNIDPGTVAEQLGVGDDHAEAQQTGSDIKIPLETWTSKTVKSEHFLALRDDVKFDPEGLTNNEVAQRQAEIKDAVTKTAAARQAEVDANGGEAPPEQSPEEQQAAHEASAQQVYEDTKAQLLATGKYTAEQAETNARVQQALFHSLGSRTGLDPLDIYSRYKLRIGTGTPVEGTPVRETPEGLPPRVDENGNPVYDKDLVEHLRSSVASGDLIKSGAKEDGGHYGGASTFPEFFQNKGYTKKGILNILDKHLSGKKLTDNQRAIFEDLYNGAYESTARGEFFQKDSGFAPEELKILDQSGLKVENGNVVDASDRFGKKAEASGEGVLSNNEISQLHERMNEIAELHNAGDLDPTTRSELAEEHKAITDKIDKSRELFAKQVADKARRGTLKAKKFEKLSDEQVNLLNDFIARSKESAKEIKDAQRPENGPYVSNKNIGKIGWAPNFLAEPTGVIGPDRISQPHTLKTGAEIDPLHWAESKYKATKGLIEKHQEAGKPLTINTSSDLISRNDYAEKLPKDTTVNMYLLSNDAGLNRQLFPGNPSRKRQDIAVAKLREEGIKVNVIDPTVESLIEAAGGKEHIEKVTGLNGDELQAAIQKSVKPNAISYHIEKSDATGLFHVAGSDESYTNGMSEDSAKSMLKARQDEQSRRVRNSMRILNQDNVQSKTIGYKPMKGLTEEQRGVEQRLAEVVSKPNAIKKYDSMPDTEGGKILDADIVRKMSPEYDKDNASRKLHSQSTQGPAGAFIDRMFRQKLKKEPTGGVMLLAGGGGSGKSSVASELLGPAIKRAEIVVDGVMANESSATGKIEAALASGRAVTIAYVHRPAEEAARGVAHRQALTGRMVPSQVLANDHVMSQETFLQLAKRYADEPDVTFLAFDNSGSEPREINVDQLNAMRYTRDGRSADEAIAGVLPSIQERLKDVEDQRRNETNAEADQSRNEGESTQAERGTGPGSDRSSEESSGTEQDEVIPDESSYTQPSDDGSARGNIQISPSRKININLLKNMDLSTFLHETGHFYMEVMGDLAGAENAPEQIKEDYTKILSWLGVGSREEIQTEHHEKWARGFEAYLMDGKAPSESLANVFGRIRTWLTNIYRNVKALHVELSPEVRGVMDRMLATDDEIKAAARETGYSEIGHEAVEPKARAKIRTLEERAKQAAETTLLKKQMEETTVEHQKFLAGEREKLTKSATDEVSKMPVFEAGYEAIRAIGTRKTAPELAEQFLSGKMKKENQAHMEEMALRYDFRDGKDLSESIQTADKSNLFDKEVAARVGAGMAKFPDLLNDRAALKAEALKAIHNDRSTELLALEHQIYSDMKDQKEVRGEVVGRKRAEAKIDADAAKSQAKQILDAKAIKDSSRPQVYITAERNAAVKATKAAIKGDFDKAAEFKRQQMLNHALAAEAMRNSDELEKSMDYLNEAAKRGRDLKDMPYGFNRQVDQLLMRFGLKEKTQDTDDTLIAIAKDMQAKGESEGDIANATGMKMDQNGAWTPENLSDFVSRVNDDYTAMIIPQSIIASVKDNFKDLTMQEMRDLTESVKTITNVGKKHDRFLNDFIKVTFKEAAAALNASIMEKIGAPYAKNRVIGSQYKSEFRERVANLANIPDGMISTMVNTLTVCHYLDGGPEGPAHDYIYRPLKEAEDRKFARYAKMREDISGPNGLMAKFFTPGELADYKKTSLYKETNSYLSKEQILAMALNWGNEGNRDRIRAGFGARDGSGRLTPMSDETIQSLFKTLGKRDWDFAQAAWDHLQTYWPEIAALEMKVRGVEAKQVERAPFSNEHGDYAGGYYPIAYDFDKSSDAFKNDQAKTELFKQYSTAAAHTDTGHTQARVSNVTRPVRLSLDVLFNHLENVVHDLEFRPAVIDVNRFLNMPDAKGALENSIGQGAKRGLDDWLKAQGSDQSENLTWLDKAFQWTRFGTTISALGLTPKAFLLHMPSNLYQAARELGVLDTTRIMTRASLDAMLGRGELKDFVFSKSERMNQRLTVRDRDIMDMARAWTDDGTLTGKVSAAVPHFAFMSLHLADEAVSVPVWADVYKNNVADLGEKGAIALADETITRRFGSGSKVDQIGLQRGSGSKKLFTMFYSWMSVMFNNAWLDGKMAGLQYNQGNVGKAAAIMAHSFFWGFALPAIHETLLKEALINKQNPGSDDDQKKRVAGSLIESPFAMIPFVRDIAGPVIHKALGEHGGDYKMSPVEMAFQNIYSPAADGARIAFTDAHYDEKFAEEVARGMSQAAGYPQQLNTWAFNLLDYTQNNGEASMKDFLSRRQKK